MTKPLHKLTPESIYHRKNRFWFDDVGTVYYGPDENNLIHPGGLDAMGKLEAIFLNDLVNAFKLGLATGKEQSGESKS